MSSYNDPAKQKSREKLREFIAKHVISRKSASDVTVACLPGAESIAEAALEVKEVYIPLGIRPENIVGIEADPEVYARLREANLGIELTGKPEFDIDFFKRTDKRFDVVSLDYKGMQTDERLEATHKLVQRRILADEAILCTVYAAKREPKKLQKQYGLSGLFGENIQIIPEDVFSELRNGNFNEAVRKSNIGMRDGITHRSIGALHNGQFPIKQSNDDAAREELRETPEAIVQLIRHALTHDTERTAHEVSTALKTVHPRRAQLEEVIGVSNDYHCLTIVGDRIYAKLSKDKEIAKVFRQMSEVVGRKHPERLARDRQELIYNLTRAVINMVAQPYRVSAIERYRYGSNKNMNMDMDLLAVESKPSWSTRVRAIVAFENGALRTNPYAMNLKKFALTLAQASDGIPACITKLPEREYLGSSFQRKKTIAFADIVDLKQSGVPLEEIADAYTLPKSLYREQALALRDAGVTPAQFKQYFGLERMTVAGWAAHRTREQRQVLQDAPTQ